MAGHETTSNAGTLRFLREYEKSYRPPLEENELYSDFGSAIGFTVDLINPKVARPFTDEIALAVTSALNIKTQASDGFISGEDVYEFLGGALGGVVGGALGSMTLPIVGTAIGGYLGGTEGSDLGRDFYNSLDFGPGNADVWSFSDSGSVSLDENEIIGQGWEQGEKTFILHTTRTVYLPDGTKKYEQFATEILQSGAEATMQSFRELNARNIADFIQGPNGLPDPDNVIPQNNDSDDDDDDDSAATTAPPTEKPGIVTIEKGKTDPTGSVYKDPYIDGFDDGNGGATIPVILDLDGDGVEVAFGEDIYFDLDDDGFLEQTSWAAADDGFLVIDKLANDVRDTDGSDGWGDGVIDQSNELVLSSLGEEGDTDLQALARYDLAINGGNGDGVLSAGDAIWTELKVWQDLNQDGKTEGDGTELKTLAAWGISAINLAYDDGTDFTDESNDVEVFGNILHGLAVAA